MSGERGPEPAGWSERVWCPRGVDASWSVTVPPDIEHLPHEGPSPWCASTRQLEPPMPPRQPSRHVATGRCRRNRLCCGRLRRPCVRRSTRRLARRPRQSARRPLTCRAVRAARQAVWSRSAPHRCPSLRERPTVIAMSRPRGTVWFVPDLVLQRHLWPSPARAPP